MCSPRSETLMSISAKQVMDLRKATDMPMMKCKKALEAEGGDFEKAIKRYVWGWRANLVVKRRQLILERMESILGPQDAGSE